MTIKFEFRISEIVKILCEEVNRRIDAGADPAKCGVQFGEKYVLLVADTLDLKQQESIVWARKIVNYQPKRKPNPDIPVTPPDDDDPPDSSNIPLYKPGDGS